MARPARALRWVGRRTSLKALGLLVSAIFLGCANVGPPRPPSLNLPRPAADLASTRVGDEIHLHWTQSGETTDAQPVRGEMTAELCLRLDGSSKPEDSCDVSRRVRVAAGGVGESIVLPQELARGAPALLHVRVRVLNPAQRSAGWSNTSASASGSAVSPIENLRATSTAQGLRLEWTRMPGEAVVELQRTELTPGGGASVSAAAGAAIRPKDARTRKAPGLGASSKPPAEVRLKVLTDEPTLRGGDPGGTIDGDAVKGVRYTYTVQRVLAVKLGGRSTELRSVPSAAIEAVLKDTFPPHSPDGLTSIPVVSSGSQPASIDLSWEAGTEPDLAGYFVYRSERGSGASAGGWKRLTAKPLAAPAYRDFEITSGKHYSYRVTAVDRSGNESSPGDTIEEELGR